MTPPALRNILESIGDTPLVELASLRPELRSRAFAKMEKFNPGGSSKDRAALGVLQEKIQNGELEPGRSVVVESSSGNLGIGLAQICLYYGLRFVCVVDARSTSRNLAILRAYQAEVEVVTECDPATGEFLPARLRRVRELAASIPHAYWPNQYANPRNPRAHEETMREVVEALDGRVDYLFCAVSTFGTLRGCADYINRNGLPTRLVAVDAVGSAIFDRAPGPRLIPGHGASIRPALADPAVPHEVVHVSDLECVAACRRLVLREGVLAGGSSGATVAAMLRLRDWVVPDSNCVLIFPDSGDRYLDTIYSDDWVTNNFGDVSHLWKGNSWADAAAC